MKLRNKKTGEIVEWFNNTDGVSPGSLAELNEEWEDYEEPKDIWWLDNEGNVYHATGEVDDNFEKNKEIGNYFKTKEEAEKAVEKLKAWKRLKDKGFRFEGIKEDWSRLTTAQTPFRNGRRYLQFNKAEDENWLKENWSDLRLLFGGEE